MRFQVQLLYCDDVPCQIKRGGGKVKWFRYRLGLTQKVGRGIALLFHDRATRRGRVVSSTPQPHFTPEKDPVSILQEAGWAPGSVWMGGKSRPHRDSIPDRPAPSQSLYRLSYPALTYVRCACTKVSQKYLPVFTSLSLRHHSCGRTSVWDRSSYQFTGILALVYFALFWGGGFAVA